MTFFEAIIKSVLSFEDDWKDEPHDETIEIPEDWHYFERDVSEMPSDWEKGKR